MMDNFWIIPIAALVIVGLVASFAVEYKINTVYPNAKIEYEQIKLMSCIQVKEKNASSSYWITDNRVFAQMRIEACSDALAAEKERLGDIVVSGTHQEKIDAGFTQLWFGKYTHDVLPLKKVTSKIIIPYNAISDSNGSEITVIQEYNNTITFTNRDSVGYSIISEEADVFFIHMILPNQSKTVLISEPGVYDFNSKPYLSGTITVHPFE